jgi:aminopeptidase N
MWLKHLYFLVLLSCSAIAGPGKKFSREITFEEDNQTFLSKQQFSDPFDGIDYRLPNNTIPIHYDIWLSTDIHIPTFSFNGLVSIRIKALENSSSITIHYRQLTIVNIDLFDSNDVLIQSDLAYREKKVEEFLIIEPQNLLLQNQEYIIKVNYAGKIRDDDAGFYRSSYVDELGNRKWLAVTQFESTDARHAFPW